VPARNPLSRTLVFALVLTLGHASGAWAQDDHWGMPLQARVAVSFGVLPAARTDSGDTYDARQMTARVGIPLIRPRFGGGSDARRFGLTLNVGFRGVSARVPFFPDRRSLYDIEGGVSGFHVFGPDNQLLWAAEAGVAEDRAAPGSPRPRLLGHVLGIRQQRPSFALIYGGAYSVALGKPRVLPVVGIIWRPSSETTVSALGPFSASVHRRVGRALVVGGRAGLSGNQFRIPSVSQFGTSSDDLRLRVRDLRFGAEAGVRLHERLVFVVDAGVAMLGHLGVAEGNARTEIYSSRVGTQPYVTVGIRTFLGVSSPWDLLGGLW
jgi:hypothetical protein